MVNTLMKNILIVWIAIFFLSSCSTIYYVPTTLAVPLISEKEELNLSFGGNKNQIEFQGSYGLNNKMAVMSNFSYVGQKQEFTLNSGEIVINNGRGILGEMGLGYFEKFDNNIVGEIYGLAAVGHFMNHLPLTVLLEEGSGNGDINGSFVRWGFQPNIGFKHKYLTFAFATRFSHLLYTRVSGDLVTTTDDVVKDYVAELRENRSQFLIEPVVNMTMGLKNVKLQLQYGRSFNVYDKEFPMRDKILTGGVVINL